VIQHKLFVNRSLEYAFYYEAIEDINEYLKTRPIRLCPPGLTEDQPLEIIGKVVSIELPETWTRYLYVNIDYYKEPEINPLSNTYLQFLITDIFYRLRGDKSLVSRGNDWAESLLKKKKGFYWNKTKNLDYLKDLLTRTSIRGPYDLGFYCRLLMETKEHEAYVPSPINPL